MHYIKMCHSWENSSSEIYDQFYLLLLTMGQHIKLFMNTCTYMYCFQSKITKELWKFILIKYVYCNVPYLSYQSYIYRLESRWTSTVVLGDSDVCHKSGRQGRMSTVPFILYTGVFLPFFNCKSFCSVLNLPIHNK